MKRSKPLQADPAKTLAWQQRSRVKVRQRPRAPLSRSPRRRKARIPPEVRRAAYARSRGVCVRPGCTRKARQLHHVLDETKFPEVAIDVDNLVGVCVRCHTRHTSAFLRLPRSALPACTLRLALRVGPKAIGHLERCYPTSGGAEPGGTGLREEQQHG